MTESVEVRVARVEENMKFLVKDAEQASLSRKSQYAVIEAIQSSVSNMVTTMASLEEKLDGQAPTIEEFITIKHKVVGAGRLGKWLWIVGGFLLGTISTSREHIIAWLSIGTGAK